MKTILFSMFLTLTACGGGSKTAPTPEPVVTPTEPAEPTEPAATEPTEAPAEAAPDPEALKADALQKETVAFEAAKPVFDKFCASCHKKGSKNASAKKLAELDITAYPFTGKHANAKDIREVLAIGGGKATMPKGKAGSVKGDDLALIAAWADAWDAADAAGAHAK